MTNHSFRKFPAALPHEHTTAVMTFPCASDAPSAMPPPPFHPVRSLPCHHPIPVFAARNAKNPQSESRFAGFVSGPICPVDFIFMTQRKEQIKNFFKNDGKNSRQKLPVETYCDKYDMFLNTLGGISVKS
ncbi:hypothetical protein [Thalassospira sp. MCCC 1A03138]|uniref:hypothetical protein n=1 Tax=Thalassospira sp. MCCC 1A03138 TaxID=1470576 RepID=UPI00111C4B9A|nr:hypothetical protein [Thalassospira sp. MCCC 1A03138]